MSEFLASRFANACPYRPGEQPKDRAYVKLNANETSVAPSPRVRDALRDEGLFEGLGRYADPYCMPLRRAVARTYGVDAEEVFVGNGSDEVLGFVMQTFMGPGAHVCFPDVTYGFYHDFAVTFGLDWEYVPVRDDFGVDVAALCDTDRHVLLANPNSPTGIALGRDEVEKIVASRPERLVVLDEAYVDYCGESCVPLVRKHRNLIVVHTMSKSRNLAGAHIGYAIAQADLVKDLENIKFAFNPFNLSAPTMAVGIAALSDPEYYRATVADTVRTREASRAELAAMGFAVLPSSTNFLLASHPDLDARAWCAELRAAGVLTRHYDTERLRPWLRVTVGTPEEMRVFLDQTRLILGRAQA